MGELIAPKVKSARVKFFDRGELPVDQIGQPILRSWLRSAQFGLDLGRPPRAEGMDAAELKALRERHEGLRRLCRSELEALNAEARETGGIVVLTNAQGAVLDAFGDGSFAGQAAEVALRPGVAWSEDRFGTNAIGAALAERRAIAVHGGEHFYDAHQILSCAAAPLIDPHGVVVGGLDLSAHAAVQQVHALGLIRLAVEQIEHRFFNGAFESRAVLRFHADPAVLGAAREGILVFDDAYRLIAANRRGLALVRQDWSALDEARFEDLFETAPTPSTRPVELRAADGGRFFGILKPPSDRAQTGGEASWIEDRGPPAPRAARDQTLRESELATMRAALDACGGNVSRAARRLGVHRSTLYRRLFGEGEAAG